MARPTVLQMFLRNLTKLLPLCIIAIVVVTTAYGVFHIYKLSPDATPAGVTFTADVLKGRLDDLKWLLSVILTVAGLFAIMQSAASYFSAQAFSKQADESIARIEKLAKEAEERFPLFAQTERVRSEAYGLLAAKIEFEGYDWRDLVYQKMDLRERQRILSVDWYLSVDLVPRKSDGATYVRDLRYLANFYASKWRYEHGQGGGPLADLERAEYYLELARQEAENDFNLLNDQGVLHLEYYRLLDTKPWTKSLGRAREFFEESLKKYTNQQRGHYNLGVADSYAELWSQAEARHLKALKEIAWEHTPLPEKECLIHYNLACARARISYSAQPPAKETKVQQAMEALEKVARFGLMREATVNGDLDEKTGDFYDLLATGASDTQKRLRELRPQLWINEGKPLPAHLGRIRRAWDELWRS